MKVPAFLCRESVLSQPSIIWMEEKTALALGLIAASIPGL